MVLRTSNQKRLNDKAISKATGVGIAFHILGCAGRVSQNLLNFFKISSNIFFFKLGLWILAYKGVLYLPDVHQCMNTQAEHVAIIFAPVMYSVLLSGKKIVNKQLKTLGLKSTYAIFQESL